MTLFNAPNQSNATEQLFNALVDSIDTADGASLTTLLNNEDPLSISPVLRQLNETQRVSAFDLLSEIEPQLSANLLDHYNDHEMRSLLSKLSEKHTQALFPFLRSSDRRMIINYFPDKQSASLTSALPEEWQEEEKAALSYPENSTGGICKNEILKLSHTATIKEFIERLTDDELNYEHQEWRYVYLHQHDGSFLGAIKLKDIFNLPDGSFLKDHLDKSIPISTPEMSLHVLKSILDSTHHGIVPVVDQRGFQIGVVGFKQLNEALYQQSKTQLLEQSGVFGGDEFRTMPTFKRNIRRLTFLLPSVILSYAAVSIIAQFESIIAQFALLAAILPLVANLSGAAGNQAVAVSIRELSVGNLSPKDLFYVVLKELPIGIINGVVIGVILSLLAFISYGSELIALPILVSIAYIISSTLAVIIGGTLPLLLKRINLDPAMLSSPLLTTLTDAISFFSVLYLAQLFLI